MTRHNLHRLMAIGAVALAGEACGNSDEPVQPVPPTTIVAVQPAPASCTLGVAVDLEARVTGAEGAAAPGVPVTFTVVTGTGSVAPPVAETDADGVAGTQFTCAAPAGPDHNAVQATFEGLQEAPAGWSLVAAPATLSAVDFLSGPVPDSTPVVDGFTEPVLVAGILRDRFGASPAATVTWEIVSGGGSLTSSSTAALRCPDGVGAARPDDWCVTNGWSIGAGGPGLRVVRLSSPDAPGFEQLFHLRVVPGPLTVTQAPASPLTGTVGSALPAPLEVSVLAGDGTPLPRVIVRFRGDGELQPVSPQDTAATASDIYTGADGRALISYRFPTSIYHSPFRPFFYVEAAVTHISAVGTAAPLWEVTVAPGPVAQLSVTGGDGQAGTAGQPLGVPLQVRATDEFGNGVAGETVTWNVTSGGGSLAEATTATFGDGLGENAWTLGPSTGTQTVTASVGALSVSFTASAASGS